MSSQRGRRLTSDSVTSQTAGLDSGTASSTPSDYSLSDVLAPSFEPASLTKMALRSVLSNLGGLEYEQLPPPTAKKQLYLDAFQEHIVGNREQLLAKHQKRARKSSAKRDPKNAIVVVKDDGSYETLTGTPLKGTPKRAKSRRKSRSITRSPANFSDDNPFQSPPMLEKRAKSPKIKARKRATSPLASSPNPYRRLASPSVVTRTIPKSPSPASRISSSYPSMDYEARQHLNSPSSAAAARLLSQRLASPSFVLPRPTYSHSELPEASVGSKKAVASKSSEGVRAAAAAASGWWNFRVFVIWTAALLFVLVSINYHLFALSPLHTLAILLACGVGVLLWRRNHRLAIYRKALALEYEDLVIQKLVEQELLSQEDPQKHAAGIPVLQLRDALLQRSSTLSDSGNQNAAYGAPYLSEKDKKLVWKLVITKIERNSNIRESLMTLKGDQHLVWEWIGPAVLSPRRP